MNTYYYPSFEKFKELSRKGNVVPVYRQLFADALTPVSAFQKISDDDYAFLLESADGGEKIARYSFLGSNPFLRFKCQGFSVETCKNGEILSFESRDPFGELENRAGLILL